MDWKPAGAERSTPRVPAKRGSEPTWRGSEATGRRSEPTSRVSSRPGGEARATGRRSEPTSRVLSRPGGEARQASRPRVSSRPGVEASRQAGERGQGRFAGPGMPFPGALGTTRRDYGQVGAEIAARFILLHRKDRLARRNSASPHRDRRVELEIGVINSSKGSSCRPADVAAPTR